MFSLFCFVLAVLASPFKSKSRLEAENAVLRHQLIVLRRKVQGRVWLTDNDRWFFIQLYRWFPATDSCPYSRLKSSGLYTSYLNGWDAAGAEFWRDLRCADQVA